MDAKALSAAAGAKVALEPTAGAVRRQVLARIMRDARDSPKADVRVRALTLAGDLARTMPDVPGLGRAVMERLLREIARVGPATRHLDLACGKAEMLCRWAEWFGGSGGISGGGGPRRVCVAPSPCSMTQ